ncbi:hypothetical protein LINPERHAP2_LOCUS39662 [Linum perenne]
MQKKMGIEGKPNSPICRLHKEEIEGFQGLDLEAKIQFTDCIRKKRFRQESWVQVRRHRVLRRISGDDWVEMEQVFWPWRIRIWLPCLCLTTVVDIFSGQMILLSSDSF